MSIFSKDPKLLISGVLMVIMMGSFFVSFQSSFALTETDTVLAEVQISVCGDGAAGGDEECDGNDLNGATCQRRRWRRRWRGQLGGNGGWSQFFRQGLSGQKHYHS